MAPAGQRRRRILPPAARRGGPRAGRRRPRRRSRRRSGPRAHRPDAWLRRTARRALAARTAQPVSASSWGSVTGGDDPPRPWRHRVLIHALGAGVALDGCFVVSGVGRECEADTASLVCRVDGDHVDLAEGLRVAEREGGEADDGTVELSDPQGALHRQRRRRGRHGAECRANPGGAARRHRSHVAPARSTRTWAPTRAGTDPRPLRTSPVAECSDRGRHTNSIAGGRR